MHDHHDGQNTSMSQKIFKLNLPVETVSVYLLCCSLTDSGQTVSTENILDIWNGSHSDLNEGLKRLEKRNIISRILSNGRDQNIYQVKPASRWK